jgi:hypothetical protein
MSQTMLPLGPALQNVTRNCKQITPLILYQVSSRLTTLLKFSYAHMVSDILILTVWFKLINFVFFFFGRCGGCSTQAWTTTYVSILRIPQMIWVWRAMVEWYIDGKTEELGGKPVPVPLCPPQISHRLTWVRTWASAVRGWWLTTWAMVRP